MILTDKQEEAFEERVAIIEYCGNIPREEADALALIEILKTHIDTHQLKLNI